MLEKGDWFAQFFSCSDSKRVVVSSVVSLSSNNSRQRVRTNVYIIVFPIRVADWKQLCGH